MTNISSLLDLLNENLELAGLGLFLFVAAIGVSRNKRHQKVAKKILKKAIDSQMNEPLTLHPEINLALCAGCGGCTKVCPEGDILKLINHQAVLVSPTKCVGHGECEKACPTGAISLVFGTKTRGMDLPRISTDYETNVPGLYIAGELGGMGLIRNAVKQGAYAARHALKGLKSAGAQYDLLVVGAGPAGLAAALEAIAQGKKYLCIEQNSFGGTVYNFPRQKIVMSVPAQLPIIGTMKFKNNKVSKEELLEMWQSVRRKTNLKVQEKTKFEGLEKSGDLFKVKTSAGEVTAHKVILAMGVRGAPRRLGLPNEDLPKVTYNLIDPEQYQGRHIVVVGGGNAGVEAAQMLAEPKRNNKVTLLVRGPGFDRCNEENKNIICVLEKSGHIQIWYNSSVTAIQPDQVTIKKESEEKSIPNEYLFVFAGAELPFKALMALGIQIDKKFGEGLGAKRAS